MPLLVNSLLRRKWKAKRGSNLDKPLYDTEINARFIQPKLIIVCYPCFALLFVNAISCHRIILVDNTAFLKILIEEQKPV